MERNTQTIEQREKKLPSNKCLQLGKVLVSTCAWREMQKGNDVCGTSILSNWNDAYKDWSPAETVPSLKGVCGQFWGEKKGRKTD